MQNPHTERIEAKVSSNDVGAIGYDMFHLSTSPVHGSGVFTDCDIAQGSHLNLFPTGETFVKNQDILPGQQVNYDWFGVKDEAKGGYWVPKDMNNKDKGWYLNHSKNPNAINENGGEFYASRDIKKGEEILIDYESLGPGNLTKEASDNSNPYEKFNELADEQRGVPEDLMLKVQFHPLASGLYGWALEHTGDLIHRMCERTATDSRYGSPTFGYEFVKEKVDKLVNTMENPYGFDREIEENRQGNYRYYVKQHPQDAPSFDTMVIELRRLGYKYSQAHKALPAYNAMHRLARLAAVAMGEERYGEAEKALRSLKSVLDQGRAAWVAEAGQIDGQPVVAAKTAVPKHTVIMWFRYDDKLYATWATDQMNEHTKWFMELGLPFYGPEYDRIERGEAVLEHHHHRVYFRFTSKPEAFTPDYAVQYVIQKFHLEGWEKRDEAIGPISLDASQHTASSYRVTRVFWFKYQDRVYTTVESGSKTHDQLMEELGLPFTGPTYDQVERGEALVDHRTQTVWFGKRQGGFTPNDVVNYVVRRYNLEDWNIREMDEPINVWASKEGSFEKIALNIPRLVQDFGKKLEARYTAEIFPDGQRSYGPILANDIIQNIMNYDPTANHEYTAWMVGNYARGEIGPYGNIAAIVAPLIQRFHELKITRNLKLPDKDIGKVKGLAGLQALLDRYEEIEAQSRSQRAEMMEKRFYNTKAATLMHNDAGMKIVIPHTVEASNFFGINTKWCTAAKENNAFEGYNSQGPLYIILLKRENKRFQFHFQSALFTDELDAPLTIKSWLIAHPQVAQIFHQIADDAESKCDTCEGNGRQKCEDCDGYGTHDCGECSGQGTDGCGDCEGDQKVQCEDCEGMGKVTDRLTRRRKECKRCEGSGRMECANCDGNGYTPCEQCGGEGHYDCEYCEEGYTDCDDCLGTGESKELVKFRQGCDKVVVEPPLPPSPPAPVAPPVPSAVESQANFPHPLDPAALEKIRQGSKTAAANLKLIQQEADKLRAEIHEDENDGEQQFADGSAVGICSNSARLMQERLGGQVYGYWEKDNPEAQVGKDEGGHDILVLGDVIVDWWGHETYGTPLIVRRTGPQTRKLRWRPQDLGTA